MPVLMSVVHRLRAAGCVFAEDEARLLIDNAGSSDALEAMIRRRTSGEPLEYVLGWVEFYGLRLAVDPGVFVPRRRTEVLAREAVRLGWDIAAQSSAQRLVVVDLCCGNGALGRVVAGELGDLADPGDGWGVDLYAADIDPAAVRCARRNVDAVAGQVHHGDLFDALPDALRGRIHVLLANVPYVPTGDIGLMAPEAREHEPLVALDGGADGLDVLRRVSAQARRWLAPGGQVLVETGERQAATAMATFAGDGLAPRVVGDDDTGATIVIGRALAVPLEPDGPEVTPSSPGGRR